jgi:hypothetical protein
MTTISNPPDVSGVSADIAVVDANVDTLIAERTRWEQKRSASTGAVAIPNLAEGVLITSASADTYGAWVEMVASLAAESLLFGVALQVPSVTSNDSSQMQIGTGAGGSETVVATIPIGGELGVVASGRNLALPDPILVAATTRIACRIAHSGAAGASTYNAQLLAVPSASRTPLGA